MKPPSFLIIKPSMRKRVQLAKDAIRREESTMTALAGILVVAPELLEPTHPYHQHREARDFEKQRLQSYRTFSCVRVKVRVTRTYVFLGKEKIFLGPDHRLLNNAMGDFHRRNRLRVELGPMHCGDWVRTAAMADKIMAYYRATFPLPRRRAKC